MSLASDPAPAQEPNNSDPKAIDRFEIFEAVALEQLQSATDASKALSVLPLPLRLTTIAATAIAGLGVLWSLLAQVPIQVYGTGAIVQRGAFASLRAASDGILQFQISGIGPVTLDGRHRQNNALLSAYWIAETMSADPAAAASHGLAPLLNAALTPSVGESFLLPEDGDDDDPYDRRDPPRLVHYPAGALLAVVDNGLERHQLKAMARTLPHAPGLENQLINFLNKTRVFAPQTGVYIVSAYQRNGALVKQGDELLSYTTEPPELPNQLPVFVDGVTAQQVNEGMAVLLTPQGVSRAQYGGIRGVVVEVNRLPIVADTLIGVVGSRAMATQIEQMLAAPHLLWIRLQRADPAACKQVMSRRCYRWSSARIPPHPVRLNTLADVQITTGYQSPFELALPAARQALGLVIDNRR